MVQACRSKGQRRPAAEHLNRYDGARLKLAGANNTGQGSGAQPTCRRSCATSASRCCSCCRRACASAAAPLRSNWAAASSPRATSTSASACCQRCCRAAASACSWATSSDPGPPAAAAAAAVAVAAACSAAASCLRSWCSACCCSSSFSLRGCACSQEACQPARTNTCPHGQTQQYFCWLLWTLQLLHMLTRAAQRCRCALPMPCISHLSTSRCASFCVSSSWVMASCPSRLHTCGKGREAGGHIRAHIIFHCFAQPWRKQTSEPWNVAGLHCMRSSRGDRSEGGGGEATRLATKILLPLVGSLRASKDCSVHAAGPGTQQARACSAATPSQQGGRQTHRRQATIMARQGRWRGDVCQQQTCLQQRQRAHQLLLLAGTVLAQQRQLAAGQDEVCVQRQATDQWAWDGAPRRARCSNHGGKLCAGEELGQPRQLTSPASAALPAAVRRLCGAWRGWAPRWSCRRRPPGRRCGLREAARPVPRSAPAAGLPSPAARCWRPGAPAPPCVPCLQRGSSKHVCRCTMQVRCRERGPWLQTGGTCGKDCLCRPVERCFPGAHLRPPSAATGAACSRPWRPPAPATAAAAAPAPAPAAAASRPARRRSVRLRHRRRRRWRRPGPRPALPAAPPAAAAAPWSAPPAWRWCLPACAPCPARVVEARTGGGGRRLRCMLHPGAAAPRSGDSTLSAPSRCYCSGQWSHGPALPPSTAGPSRPVSPAAHRPRPRPAPERPAAGCQPAGCRWAAHACFELFSTWWRAVRAALNWGRSKRFRRPTGRTRGGMSFANLAAAELSGPGGGCRCLPGIRLITKSK